VSNLNDNAAAIIDINRRPCHPHWYIRDQRWRWVCRIRPTGIFKDISTPVM